MTPAGRNQPRVTHLYINPILELLKAGEIVGLNSREMLAIALEELAREQEEGLNVSIRGML